jgi:monofunctional glycosyltransferase
MARRRTARRRTARRRTARRRTARRRPARRSLPYRIGWLAGRLILGFVLGSLAAVLMFRFVPPPITWTMIGDMAGGRSVTKDWMSLARMDPDMARAAIAAEDGNFCRHHGFDFAAIQKAFAGNEAGRRYRGGSTISQQTAKNVFLWQGRSWLRKGLETWFTALIEALWPKRRIVEVYLNVAETGIGTYGANAGAMRYFHHDASRLSPVEAARIAAILPLPKKREAIDPDGSVRRYGNNIAARMPRMRRAGFYACLQ